MFKVNKPEMVNKTFRMPAELVERLNVVAQTQKVSLNNLVCQCCEYALDNLSEPKEDCNKYVVLNNGLIPYPLVQIDLLL